MQDITEEDALSEGVTARCVEVSGLFPADFRVGNYRFGYAALWDSINKKPGTRWVDNPWVWRIEFSGEVGATFCSEFTLLPSVNGDREDRG